MNICKECGIKERPAGRSYRYCPTCALKVKKEKHNLAGKNYVQKNKEKVLASRRDRDRKETAKVRYSRFRNTDKYREYARTRYHLMDENKRKARYTILNAIRDGKIIRPNNCERCGIEDWGVKRTMIEANHYLGYEPENWLKVEWICTNCHKLADGFIKKELKIYEYISR